MFERFTAEARQVIVHAQEEARGLKHNYIGTEHILLGVLREEEQRLDRERPLQALGVTLNDAREKVARMVGSGDHEETGQIPFTPRAKKVLELALREALSLGQNWIGPEHIVLGLARENEGVASRVLLEFDVDSVILREAVVRALGDLPPRRPVPFIAPSHTVHMSVDAAWLEGLGGVLSSLAREIREQLEREPDLGDLLLVIASAQEMLAGRALRELEVDLDALWGKLERLRQTRAEEQEQLMQRIDELRAKKREALDREEFQEAAAMRDEERELTAQLRSQEDLDQEVLREVRRRLGLS